MRKTLIGVLILCLSSFPVSAEAGIDGSKCYSKGQIKKKDNVKYECKLVSGIFRWQKVGVLSAAQKQKAIGDCIISLIGAAGFSNDDLINADRYCRSKIR